MVSDRPRSVPDELVRQGEMARILGVSESTFKLMRRNGREMGMACPQVDWGHKVVLFKPGPVWRWAESYAERRRAA